MGRGNKQSERKALARARAMMMAGTAVDGTTVTADHIKLYYGDEKSMRMLIPISMDNNPPKGVKPGLLNTFGLRSIPVFLGMLAEIDENKELTLDQLNDVTSEEAKIRKINAGNRLREFLPRQDLNGKWLFNHDKFIDFFYRNTKIVVDKMMSLVDATDNMNFYDKARYINQYYNLVNGLFDGYNQQFFTEDFLRKDHPQYAEFRKLFDRSQGLTTYLMIIADVRSKINAADFSEGKERVLTEPSDRLVYLAGDSYLSRKYKRQVFEKLKDPNQDPAEVEKERIRVTTATPLIEAKIVDKKGILCFLTGFERNLLAIDEELMERMHYVPIFTEGVQFATDVKLIYTDKDGVEHSMLEDEIDYVALAKIRAEIYEIALKDRYAVELLAADKEDMRKFLAMNDMQRLAKVQTEVLREDVNKLCGDIMDRVQAGEYTHDAVHADFYDKMVAAFDAIDNLTAGASEAEKIKFDIAISQALTTANSFKDYINTHSRRNRRLLDDLPLAERAIKMINTYKAKKDELETALAAQYTKQKEDAGKELEERYTFSAMDSLLDFVKPVIDDETPYADQMLKQTVERPENMPEDVFNAIMLGAFLSAEVAHAADIAGAEGELKSEKVWMAILNDVMIKGQAGPNFKNVPAVLALARQKGIEAINAYVNGDKSKAYECIKNFADASIRLYDKSKLFDGLDNIAVLNRDMLELASKVIRNGEFRNLSSFDSTIASKQAATENIKEVLNAGYASATNVLSGSILTEEARSNAVLNMLTNAYLTIHANEDKLAKNSDLSANLVDILDAKKIDIDPALKNDANLGDMSAAINKLYDMTHMDSLEANFVDEKATTEFLEHVHNSLKNTTLYTLLMTNDRALDDLATNGAKSALLSGSNHQKIMDIKYIRTEHDAVNKAADDEYLKQVDEILPTINNTLMLKKTIVDVTKNEIVTRPDVNFKMPLFAQYAGRIADSLSEKADEIVAYGYSKEKLTALIDKIREYKKAADLHISAGRSNSKVMQEKALVLVKQLEEIEPLYKEFLSVTVNIEDGPFDLIEHDKKILREAKAESDIEEGFSLNGIIDSGIKEYNSNKLLSKYEDVSSRQLFSDFTVPAITEMLENLKQAPADGNYDAEYQNVIRGAEYLLMAAHAIAERGDDDSISNEEFTMYKEALEAFAEKITSYNATAAFETSERKDTVKGVESYVTSVIPRVKEADNIRNAKAINEAKKAKADKVADEANKLDGNFNTKIDGAVAYKEKFDRKLDNFVKVFADKPDFDSKTWAGEYANQHMKNENNYDASKLPGYTKEEIAILTGIIAFSRSLQGMTDEDLMFGAGTTFDDIFIERTGATGDARLAGLAEKARSSMNELMTQMAAGNYATYGKYFKEGLRIIGANIGAERYGLTNILSNENYKLAKQIQDMIDRHPELQNILATRVEGEQHVEEKYTSMYKSCQELSPVVDAYVAAKTRVGNYLKNNTLESITIDANSDIAKDLLTVITYEKLCDKTTDERDAVNKAAEARAFEESEIKVKEAEKLRLKAGLLKVKLEGMTGTDEASLKEKAAISEEIATLEMVATTLHQSGEKVALNAKSHVDLFTEGLRNISMDSFNASVEAEKALLFGNNASRTFSVNQFAAVGINDEHDYVKNAINAVNVNNTEFRKSAVADYHGRVKEYLEVLRDTAPNEVIKQSVDLLIARCDYVVDRLNMLGKPRKDGSFVSFPEELENSVINALENLNVYTNTAYETTVNAGFVAESGFRSVLSDVRKGIATAVKTDVEALKQGALYGPTNIQNVNKQLNTIGNIANTLTATKAWGDGSSPEFRTLLNDLAKFNEEKTLFKHTAVDDARYAEKIDKLYESARDYLRYKQFHNNGSLRSTTRIAETKKLVEYLGKMRPLIKDEVKANSFVSRFEKLGYSKDKVDQAEIINNKLESKRKELEKLVNDPYKKMSERALAAREKLVELYLKNMPKDGYPKGSPESEQVKDCIATILLEKRLKYERIAKQGNVPTISPARNMETIFLDTLAAKDDEDNIHLGPDEVQIRAEANVGPEAVAAGDDLNPDENAVIELMERGVDYYALDDDIREDIYDDDISMEFSVDEGERDSQLEALREARAAEPRVENVYDHMINQVKGYNFINDEYLKPNRIFKLITDESEEVDRLYMNSMHKAMNRHEDVERDLGAEKAVKEEEKRLNM